MDEHRDAGSQSRHRWLRYVGEAVAVITVLVCIFHRPILLNVGRAAARHFAAQEHLALDCRLEGSVFTNLIVRNLHVTPTGPTIVESVDVDYIRADYNLLHLMRYGASEFLKNVEVQSAKIVLNPANAAVKAKVPPDQPLTLPTVFPDRVYLRDVNVTMRTSPQDFVLQGLNLELDPKNPATVAIAKLQLPTTPAWTHVAGRTSYTNKDLIINDLVLDDANRFRVLAIDASKISSKQLGVSLDVSLAGGTVSGTVDVAENGKSLDTRAHLVVENVSLDTVRGYIGRREGELTGNVDRMAVDFRGVLAAPKTWNGTVAAAIRDVKQGQLGFERGTLAITASNGTARLDVGEITKGANSIRLKGSADLPASIREFGRSPANFEIGGALPDLRSATAEMPQPISGAANVTGHVQVNNARLTAELKFNGGDIAAGAARIGQVSGTLTASKRMPPPNATKPYFADLQSEVRLDASDVVSGNLICDALHAEIRTANEVVTVEQLTAVRKQNTVAMQGSYRLPADLAQARLQPASVSVSVSAPQLGDYFPAEFANKITGPLQADGEISMHDGIANGQLQIFGSNLHVQNLAVPQVSAQISVAQNVVYLNDFTAKLNDRDFATGTGFASLEKPYRYSGTLSANIADLSTLRPLLLAAGNKSELAGALMINWQGSGTGADFKNTGTLKVTLDNGRYAKMQKLQAKIDASYTPDGLDVPIIFVASDTMDFQAVMQAKGEALEISKIQVDQGQAKYATAYIALPFVWGNLGTDRPLFPKDGKVVLNVQSENLDLKKLFEDLGQKAPVSGSVNLKVESNSTLADLSARLDFALTNLQTEAAKLEPATFNITADLQHNRLNISGKLQQAKIQPVAITAEMPIDVPQILREKTVRADTPVKGKVEMPRSSMNFIRQFVPAISQLDGEMAMNVNLSGTIAKPDLSGSADISINVARFTDETLPALTAFHATLTFRGNTLSFDRFEGELAGGPLRVAGRITFPKLTEPTFDLQLRAESALVARNDSLTARADANVQVTGPLASATVKGEVALTNSHFLKNLDLIPIGLPGRPAPQPPADHPTLTFPQPPIRDWKFDVAVKTKDPFQIRGNLASGGAIVNLHLGGTGLQPVLEGQVRMENVEATLPFSRLEIQYGYLYFNPDDPLNPKIDLHGTSLIRDYTVHVYVYGTALAPEAVFTSEPPLPQEEIISLLATGTTREELTGNNDVLAGRAAMLLFQQLYRKIFKKSDEPKTNSVFDRLQVDVGGVDPRTGQKTATARYKIDNHWMVLGEIEVGGDFRGMVRYLLRFR